MRVPLDIGLGQYDDAPPDSIDNIDELIAAGRCRFANEATAWADIEDGRIVARGSNGRGLVASTEVGVARASAAIPAVPFPEIAKTIDDGDQSVTFLHTAGGRTGAPFPRRVRSRSILKMTAPTAWSTIAITINADGSTSGRVHGASHFPRHWFYVDGQLRTKSARIDYRDWSATTHDSDTPWGDAHQSIDMAACETALERGLSHLVMRAGSSPKVRKLAAGEFLMRHGEPATTMVLILDGLVEVSIDGQVYAESGPGALLGERAMLEAGTRTADVRALTAIKIAEVDATMLDRDQLERLRDLHRREEST
jgi:hypothetical protein